MFDSRPLDPYSREKNIIKEYSKSIEQKGMTFDHDFGYSLPSLKKRKEEKENVIVIKSHAFLVDLKIQVDEIILPGLADGYYL